MADTFNPGPGWREVTGDSSHPDEDILIFRWRNIAGSSLNRYFVRESPVPPLPTEPGTVIRVTWRESEDDRLANLLVRDDEDWSAVGADQWHTIRNLPDAITGWEVLSEPRAVTAKAALDFLALQTPIPTRILQAFAREFGVSS